MKKTTFSELKLTPKMNRAVVEMGFDFATPIQSEAIPLIRTGVDVIGLSQTGTGKTIAFAIPAMERIDTHEDKPTVQVLILCPTRELAQQGCEEIRKLAKFKEGIRPVSVYGGAPMDRQIRNLKRANLVIGTPGRVMDLMRRRVLKLENIKMVILDEADEMLSMGFKEDIETILKDTPDDRQTILFSATMSKPILAITKQFLKKPEKIEIDKDKVTLENITQNYIDVPMGRKLDSVKALLKFHQPQHTIIFCNTKRMVDKLTEYLSDKDFSVEGLHGDMKQSQRTTVMNSFKSGRVAVLVATDIAARGIDVKDIEYVINYDIPQSTEYYVHRIGRTGRAGKSGCSITICSGRRQITSMRSIAHEVKSEITKIEVPSDEDINSNTRARAFKLIEEEVQNEKINKYEDIVGELLSNGASPNKVIAALLRMHFGDDELITKKSKKPKLKCLEADMHTVVINIGRNNHIAPNHIVGAITERTSIDGSNIGKIEIYDDKSTVDVKVDSLDAFLELMKGCKICRQPVITKKANGEEVKVKSKKVRKEGKSSKDYGYSGKSVKRKKSATKDVVVKKSAKKRKPVTKKD